MNKTPRIAIVGAGVGGLSAAAILSRHYDVSIFEASDSPGGKIRQIEFDGQKIDSGPTVFTMKWVFESLFEQAGASFNDHLHLNQLTTLARHGWRDGTQLDLFADIEQSAEAIGDFTRGRDSENYRTFCKRTEKAYRSLRDTFLRASDPSMLSLMTRANPFDLLATGPFSTLWQSLSRQFEDPRLRQLFGRYATYCGSSPFQAPATLMLIAHVEQAGVWTLNGGMKSLATALCDVATNNGATLHTNAPVSRIETDTRGVRAVIVRDGDRHEIDFVIFNGDRAALSRGLLGPDVVKASRPIAASKRSQSAMTWSMLGKAKGFDLSAHTVFFSDDYKGEFDAVFREGRVPNTPTTYIFAPDRANGSVVPDQRERLFCLINAPASDDPNAYDSATIARSYERMSTLLSDCGLTIEAHRDTVQSTTPADFGTMFPATGGALYGMASHGWRASFERPGVRSKIDGLYLAGGSVHPGAGVPMAALSGMAAAKEIKKQCVSTSR